MRLGSVFGWGIVLYAVMFLTWSLFLIYGATQGALPRTAVLLVLIATATIAGRSLGFRAWKDILPYSFSWAVIAALFDAAVSVPFTGWALYTDWSLWAGYALVVLVPLFAPLHASRRHMPAE